jgi:phospholipid transport system substrate-binding protein
MNISKQPSPPNKNSRLSTPSRLAAALVRRVQNASLLSRISHPHLISLALLLTASRILIASPATQPTTDQTAPAISARLRIEKLLTDVQAVLQDPHLTKLQRSLNMRQLAAEIIDFPTLSRLTMAQNWRGLSDQQRGEFIVELKRHLSATYAHTTDDYANDEEFIVDADRQEPDGDWTIYTRIVGSKRENSNQDVTKVDYRLRRIDNRWKVIDVTIDNVSLVSNFRAQFKEIMANDGFDHLLQLLRDKNADDDK